MSGSEEVADHDEVLIDALVRGSGWAEAGTVVGLSAEVVRERMADPVFAGEVSARRGERVAQLSAGLVELSREALGVAGRAFGSSSQRARLRAAVLVLNEVLHHRASTEIADRVEILTSSTEHLEP